MRIRATVIALCISLGLASVSFMMVELVNPSDSIDRLGLHENGGGKLAGYSSQQRAFAKDTLGDGIDGYTQNGTIQGRVFDRHDSPVADATVAVEHQATGACYYTQSNGTGFYRIDVPPTSSPYYLAIANQQLTRNESAESAVVDSISENETCTIDIYTVGAKYSPVDMTEGVITNLSVLIYDDRLIVGDMLTMQITLTSNSKYNITEEFIRSWIQGNGNILDIITADESEWPEVLARLYVEIPVRYDAVPPTATVSILPNAVENGAIQVHSNPFSNGHIYCWIPYNTHPEGICVEQANYPPLPYMDITPTSPTMGESVSFDASVSQDPDGSITHYNWSFGDGTSVSGIEAEQVQHTYPELGEYIVNLTVTDNNGTKQTTTKTLSINPSTVYVDDDYTAGTPGWQETRFSSIQSAVYASVEDAIVIVNNGTYQEHITVNKTLSLLGENPHETIITGKGDGNVIYVAAKGVTIRGFTVCDGYAGIWLDSNYNLIEECIICNHTGSGIELQNASGNVLKNNILRDNNRRGNYYRNNVASLLAIPPVNISYYLEHDIDVSFEVDMKYAFDTSLNPEYSWGEYGDKLMVGVNNPKLARGCITYVSSERSGYSDWNTFNISDLFGMYSWQGHSISTLNDLYQSINTHGTETFDFWEDMDGEISIFFEVLTDQVDNTYGDGDAELEWSGLYVDNVRVYVTSTNETIWESPIDMSEDYQYVSAGWEHFGTETVPNEDTVYSGYDGWQVVEHDASSPPAAWYCGSQQSFGMYLDGRSNNNSIYDNDFIQNDQSAHDGGTQWWLSFFNGPDRWYNVTNGTGNYWSDYDGSDADHDGIGDTPYAINPPGAQWSIHPEGYWYSGTANNLHVYIQKEVNISSNTTLSFDMKTNIEEGWDFLTVEYSTTGENWTAMNGTYTQDGLITGVYEEWVTETMQFPAPGHYYLRFRYVTDAGVQGGGADFLPGACIDNITIDGILEHCNVTNNWTTGFIPDITDEYPLMHPSHYVDTRPPTIESIDALPDPQTPEALITIHCSIWDDIAVDGAQVIVTYPNGTEVNMTMTATADGYSSHTTFSQEGIYHYRVWTQDSSGNANVSDIHEFHICAIANTTNVTAGENVVNATDSGVQVQMNATTNTSIGIGNYSINPAESLPSGIVAVGRYIEVNIANESAVQWPVYLAIYYTQSDLDDAGLEEDEIQGMYYYDDDAGMWRIYNNTGVHTSDVTVTGKSFAGYVWAYAWPGQLSPKVIGGKSSGSPIPPSPPSPPSLPDSDKLIFFDGPAEWNRTHWDVVAGTLICIDEDVARDAGIVELYYRVDNGSWERWTECICSCALSPGMHSIYYYGVDSHGRHTNTARIVINVVNGVAPVTTCDMYPPRPDADHWYTDTVTICLDAVDGVSGVSETFYRFNEGKWLTYTESIVVATDGQYTLEYYSVDNTGNEEQVQSTTFNIDKTSPTLTFQQPASGHLYLFGSEILPLPQTVIIGQATLSVDAADDTAGIERVEFYIDDELQKTVTEESFELVWDEPAFWKHTIQAIAVDKAGNRAAVEQEIWIFNPF